MIDKRERYIGLIGLKIKPLNQLKSFQFDYELDGLRGLCALVVAFAHILIFDHLIDTSFHPPKSLKYVMFPHEAVLLFFIISGYVIGLTNHKPIDRGSSIKYIKKRIIRIYPIYIIAVLISALFLRQDAFQTVISNLFFVQELYFSSIPTNPPVWSLNFEVIFYILFIFIWWFQPSLIKTTILLLAIGSIGWFFPEVIPPVLQGYALGFIFWLSGLLLAWYIKPGETKKYSLVSLLLLLLAFANFKPGLMLFEVLGFGGVTTHLVNLSDVFTLPICLAIISITTGRPVPGLSYLITYSYILIGFISIYLIVFDRITDRSAWMFGVGSAFFAFLLLVIKQQPKMRRLSFIGGFSYALYVFHFPLAILVSLLEISIFPNAMANYVIKALIWVLLSFSLSYLAEIVIQPKVKKLFT